MHIHTLRLERFRGAQDLTLELDPKLNVFVGVNGAGKSSVLDAAAILLSWLANRIKSSGASGRPIVGADIHNGESTASLTVDLDRDGSRYSWGVTKAQRGHNRKDRGLGLTEASAMAEQLRDSIAESRREASLPLLAYYPVNRAVLDIPLRIRKRHDFDLPSAYDGSLDSGANFRAFFEWFREREDLENEAWRDSQLKVAEPSPTDLRNPQLEAVRTALEQLMPEYGNLTVCRDPLRMEVCRITDIPDFHFMQTPPSL